MIPYADVTFGDAYFATQRAARAAPWLNATTRDKAASTDEATRLIDMLNFAGHKFDESTTAGEPSQVNQFPRGTDSAVPNDVRVACCELALKLLDDVDVDFEVENLSRASQGIGDARTTRDTSAPQDHVRAGIPSIRAWQLLYPFLVDPRHAIVSRES